MRVEGVFVSGIAEVVGVGSLAIVEEGVGIGLYLAREIVKLEGGYMKVSSKPGEGSEFAVFLKKE